MLFKSQLQALENNIYRVVIADDHEIFRQGLSKLIQRIKYVKLVGDAENGTDLLRLVEDKKPDLVITDINMPYLDGYNCTEILSKKYPYLKIIALSMHNDKYSIEKMFENGAHGYLTKNIKSKLLEEAITSVMNNEKYLSPEAAINYSITNITNSQSKFSNIELRTEEGVKQYHITSKEQEVLELIKVGFTSREIADKLFISSRTVETHKQNIFKKFDVASTIELIHLLENGKIR